MQTSIAAETRLAHLWSEAGSLAAKDIEQGWKVILRGLADLVESPWAVASIWIRDEEGYVEGWRPLAHYEVGRERRRSELGRRWRRKRQNLTEDPVIVDLLRRYGDLQVVSMSDSTSYQESTQHALMQKLGAIDRIVVSCPLEKDVQIGLVFDRLEDQPPFDEADRRHLEIATSGLLRNLRWLALGVGALPNKRALSKREREALAHLLGGMREREIASEMGLKEGSLHQLVMRVYRKMNVGSRAELMALWLERPA